MVLGRKMLAGLLGAASFALMIAALYMVFVYAPTEAVQGNVQRIFYFHVPCAWVAFLSFGISAVASGFYLYLGEQLWDDIAYSAAEVGMVFCTLVLITGSLWAKPIWGTWWTWDSRLTTTFILWLLYAGYLILRQASAKREEIARFAAVLAIIAVADIPLIVVSVRLWRTIHPAVLAQRTGGHGLEDRRMVYTLLVATVAVMMNYAALMWLRLKTLRTNARFLKLCQRVTALQTNQTTPIVSQ